MTDPVLRSTYRRADGSKIYSSEMVTGQSLIMLNARPTAVDYIEEQRDENYKVVRFRTIRLGTPEKCDGPFNFNGEVNPYISHTHCWNCKGTGVKPRDLNPPWTEPRDSTTGEKCGDCDGSGRIASDAVGWHNGNMTVGLRFTTCMSCNGWGMKYTDAELECRSLRVLVEQWKAIATQLAKAVEYAANLDGATEIGKSAIKAYESALAQEPVSLLHPSVSDIPVNLQGDTE